MEATQEIVKSSPSIKVPRSLEPLAATLAEKREAAQPLKIAAAHEAAQIEEVGNLFVDTSRPEEFVQFAKDLLAFGTNGAIKNLGQTAGSAYGDWYSAVVSSQDLRDIMERKDRTDSIYEILKKASKGLHTQETGLRGRIKWVKEYNAVRSKERLINGLIGLYDTEVKPIDEASISFENSVTQATEKVAEKLKEMRYAEKQPNQLTQLLTSDEAIEQMEDNWLKQAVDKPLAKMEISLDGQDQAPDGTTFQDLKRDFIDFIKRTNGNKDNQENTGIENYHRHEEEVGSFRTRFSSFGLYNEFFSMFHSLTLGDANKGFDTKDVYGKWADAISVFTKEGSSAWNIDFIKNALDQTDSYQTISSSFRDNLRTLIYASFSLTSSDDKLIAPHTLLKLPAYDRWQAIKTYLISNNIIHENQVDAFEAQLAHTLVYNFLIPGGHESWDGTEAVQKLADLNTPQTLADLLYYQAVTLGSSGFNSAGHTSAAAQGVFDEILRKTDRDAIEGLSVPNFIKNTLLELKDREQRFASGDPYDQAVFTASLVGARPATAISEIEENWDANEKWVIPVLRSTLRNAGALSADDYEKILSLPDKNPYLQLDILRMLRGRIPGDAQTLVSRSDFPKAVWSISELIKRQDFPKTPETLTQLYVGSFLIDRIAALSPEEIRTIEEESGMSLTRTHALPLEDQIHDVEQFQERIIGEVTRWLGSNLQMDGSTKFIALSLLDAADARFSRFAEVASELYKDPSFTYKGTDGIRNLQGGFRIYSGDDEKRVHMQDLTDLLVKNYLKHNDQKSADAIVSAFSEVPSSRRGIKYFFEQIRPEDGENLPPKLEELKQKMEQLEDWEETKT